jgi:hypothetical protein
VRSLRCDELLVLLLNTILSLSLGGSEKLKGGLTDSRLRVSTASVARLDLRFLGLIGVRVEIIVSLLLGDLVLTNALSLARSPYQVETSLGISGVDGSSKLFITLKFTNVSIEKGPRYSLAMHCKD